MVASSRTRWRTFFRPSRNHSHLSTWQQKNGNGLVICAKFEAKGEMVVMQADTLPDIKIDGDMVYDPRLYLFNY